MRVLVTGHLGYIGSVLTPLLTAAGHEVTGLDTGFFEPCLLGPAPAEVPSLKVDLRDVEPEHCAGFDAVLHLAALSNDPLGNLAPQITYDINQHASVRLAAAAKAAGVRRFLFSSSCSLYGAGGEAPVTEDAPFYPVTPYGESKVLAEQEISKLASADFVPVYLRNATAYGLSPRLRGDIVVNNLVAHAVTTGKVLLQSDGTPWRPLVHVEDISRAFVALLDAEEDLVRDRAYNIGLTSENYRIREVAELVGAAVEGSVVSFAEGASSDKRDYRVDCERIAAEIPGFQPQWTVPKGIAQLVAAYREHGLTAEEFAGVKFQRIARIRELLDAGLLGTDLRYVS
ncbi:NAD-dependent epimerase/dehydratase family protein [Longispora albida]|uniref:NAD-dependent epimerase/dehydratase family protein n=1 Tax=Longispora albida TaxID=203523 RepID=UPI0004760E5B|nr:SDR family oxidoreductase [Longispora albida]